MGSPPLPMRRSCLFTAVVTLTILAYKILAFFGLTAKQPLLSTNFSIELKMSNRVEMCCHPMSTFSK